MGKLFKKLFNLLNKEGEEEDAESVEEVDDEDAEKLSYVGNAAYEALRKGHSLHHNELWNVTTGKVVGKIQMTPKDAFTRMEHIDPPDNHDDWFPKRLGEVIGQTKEWCDIMTLAPPDGLFLTEMKKAFAAICNQSDSFGNKHVVIRLLMANIVGMPVNCKMLIDELTKDLPSNADKKIKLWVGAWRKGVSWNHAKIIAVDGKHLWTGGHNFWNKHYLLDSPVNDLSLELEGSVARDAHRYANAQWGYIVKKQSTAWGRFVDKRIPDAFEVPRMARVTVSDFPEIAAEFPPYWKEKKTMSGRRQEVDPTHVPIVTMGRYGVLLKKSRPSDDAFVAMIDSARKVIRMALQDLGPVCLPKTKLPLPGLTWPKAYLDALARVIWTKGVDVEIVLSNPNSIPGDCSPTEANYGNGWDCVDVAAEIIKRIQKQFPKATDHELRRKVGENLRLCFLKSPRGGSSYKSGATLGLHCTYLRVMTSLSH